MTDLDLELQRANKKSYAFTLVVVAEHQSGPEPFIEMKRVVLLNEV